MCRPPSLASIIGARIALKRLKSSNISLPKAHVGAENSSGA